MDPKSDGGKFIFEDIPAMRNAIESSTGVRMPGINVQEDPSSSDRYVVQLDEVPAASGVVCVGSKYSMASPPDLAAAVVVGEDLVESTDPVSGLSGHWCSAAHAEALTKRGVAVQSETQFVLAHVDLVLRRHLDEFLGVEEFESLVMELEKQGPMAPTLTSALADGTFFIFFARVLRALVREQVPITAWTQILETLQRLESRNVGQAVSQVRLTLRDRLPGNQEIVEYVEVPTEWQDRILRDQRVFDASPIDAHGMLVEIRRLLEQRAGRVALVASTPLLRIFVRRLIEFEFPSVAVLWGDEVLRQERLVPAEGPAPMEPKRL